MKQIKFIQGLIQSHQNHKAERIKRIKERELNKPQYTIKNLYVGSIVKIDKEWYSYQGCKSIHNWTYTPVKDYAILEIYNNAFSRYEHIATLKCIDIRHWNQEGEYVVDDVVHFYKKLQTYMLKNNLQLTDKLSRRQIIELENELNKNCKHSCEEASLFNSHS